MSDSQPSGTCTTLCVMKIITFELSKKGRFDILAMYGAKAHTGCTPWSPNPPASPAIAISPSITDSRFTQLPTVILFDFSSPYSDQQQQQSQYFVSIEFQKQWVHPSRKCDLNTALLWLAVTPAPCFMRGYQLEQRWPGSRPKKNYENGLKAHLLSLPH